MDGPPTELEIKPVCCRLDAQQPDKVRETGKRPGITHLPWKKDASGHNLTYNDERGEQSDRNTNRNERLVFQLPFKNTQ